MEIIIEFGKMFLIGGGIGIVLSLLLLKNRKKEDKQKKDRLSDS